MNIKIFLVVLSAFFLQQTGPSISGVVVDAATRLPIAGAHVLLADETSLASALLSSTDDTGAFAFSHLSPGAYRVLAERDAYLRGERTESLVLAADQRLENIAIALTPEAAISGRIINEFGEAAPKISVTALSATGLRAEAKSNDLGEYRLFGLQAGAYIVTAERYPPPRIEGVRYLTPTPPCLDCFGEGFAIQTVTSLLSAGGFIDPLALSGPAYATVFYPGTTNRAEAQAVDVRAGAEVRGIDLRMIRESPQ